MKVSDQNSPIQLDAYIRQAQQQKKPDASSGFNASGTSASDKVELSAQAKEIQQATQVADRGSDVRADKVRQVKMEVESGTYKVVGAKVATDMLKETFENNIILQKVNTRA